MANKRERWKEIAWKKELGDVDWDKYEILPDGNWYSFVKNGQRYYISYSDVGH